MLNRNLTEDEKSLVEDQTIREEFKEQYIDELGFPPTEEELTDYMIDFFAFDEEIPVHTNKPDDSPFGKLFGAIFLVWFMASFIGMIYFFETNPSIGFIIFGQYFLVFGIVALFSKIKLGLLFAGVGLGIIVIPILIRHPELLSFSVNWEFLGLVAFGVISLCSGLTVLGCWINAKNKLKAKCTSFVDATVILIKREKTPIYEFEFNNKKFKIRGCLDKKKKVGDHCNLQVNPNNPREVYFDFIREKIATYLFSLSFAASGIVLIVIAFINFL